MSFKLIIKNGDMKWLNDEWVEEDIVHEYEDNYGLGRALAEFLYSVEDGERVTLKYLPLKDLSKVKKKKSV